MTLVEEEVYRRMPALDLIEDKAVRDEVVRLTAEAPDYFWTVPASTSGYHHPACRGEHGLWVHTLMVCTAVKRLVESYELRYDLEADHAFAAAILHDQRKNGDPSDPAEKSVQDHDLMMAEVISEESALPLEVENAVASHMGPWYDGVEPAYPLDELVHSADMIASTSTATLAVPGPLPEELEGLDLQVIRDV